MAFLQMRGITKRFGEVLANDKIDFDVECGEIHALLGENGAGKSTLMNVLYGMYDHFSGTIRLDGEKLHIRSPKDAIAHGIGMVHQHFMLVNAHSIVENVILGLPGNKAVLDVAAAAKRIRNLAKKLEIEIDPYACVNDLTVGQQQRVEIIKALYRDVSVLILDEPTAVLTPGEVDGLFAMLRKLAEEGMTIILISHKLTEIMDICTRCTILRQGRFVTCVNLDEVTDKYELATLMVDKELIHTFEKTPYRPGEVVLRVEDLCYSGENHIRVLDQVSFELHEGEILGICGVDGNGQSELIRCITGLNRPESGTVELLGSDVTGKSAREILKMGVAHIPEDRLKMAVLKELSINDNLMLMDFQQKPFNNAGWLRKQALRKRSRELCERYNIKTPDIDEILGNLSGGNQQKVVVGRELSRRPKLLVAMHPDRGLDVGAAQYIQEQLLHARESKTAVLLVSTELEEILEMSDTILVMYKGRVVGSMPAAEAAAQNLGPLMAGIF
jgi:simple sugar transport system ATP-binding protein